MPDLPMYDRPADPDAWHRVTAPGGYEWWYFDAEDAAGRVRVVAILLEGFVFHPGYLRRYADYLRRPTRRRPPVAGEYPCVYLAVYEDGKVLAQAMRQYEPGEFSAATDRPNVRIGPSGFGPADGSLRLSVQAPPWRLTWRGPQVEAGRLLSADLTFRPRVAVAPCERVFLSREMTGADHRWVLANPLCDVEGTLRLNSDGPNGGVGGNGQTERTIAFTGRGYHDHNYGSGPIGPGPRRWIWGRVFGRDRVLTFHLASPRGSALGDEVHLVEAGGEGVREVACSCEADWSARSPVGLAFPKHITLGEHLRLSSPKLVDVAPFYMRLTYRAEFGGETGTAFCEVAYPHRLHWPVLGRMIEMSISRAESAAGAAQDPEGPGGATR